MAERIWGEARVASEWSSESWMPAQVRRWIPKARALAAGGWRDLVPRHIPEPWRATPTAGSGAERPFVRRDRRRRRIGNSPAIRAISGDMRGRELT